MQQISGFEKFNFQKDKILTKIIELNIKQIYESYLVRKDLVLSYKYGGVTMWRLKSIWIGCMLFYVSHGEKAPEIKVITIDLLRIALSKSFCYLLYDKLLQKVQSPMKITVVQLWYLKEASENDGNTFSGI